MRKTSLCIALLAALLLVTPASAQITMDGNVPDSATRVRDSAGTLLPFSIGKTAFSFVTGTTITIPSGVTIAYTSGTFDLAIAATDQFLVDANTTNHTGTDPVFEIDMETLTADNVAFGLGLIQKDGATAGEDAFLGQWTMTGNDANGDMKGILFTAAATANATTATYEYFFTLDCAENTAAACTDGIVITSSGANTGLTDAIDVSAANITNAINIGVNPIVTGNVAGTIGDATTDSWTFTTDGAGDAEAVLPENSIGPDEVAVFHDTVILCGQADEAGTIFVGPALAPFLGDGSTSYALGTAACDALDNATEATADLPLTNVGAYKITGMRCVTDGTMGAAESQIFTLRSAEGDIVPTVTCTIGEAATYCSTVTGSTTDVAAGATLAVEVLQASDNADDNVWCQVGIAYK